MKKQGTDIIQDGMMGYSAYVLLQRAIPNLYDGLKISYRRILYSMYQNKINTFTKSQNVVGEVAKIHPHGSVYTSMVGMAQKDRHIQPFIDGKGSFGEYISRDLTASAERYTNVRMNDYGRYMMKDIDKGQVSFSDSYDGTQQLPDLLPVKFPLILAFAQSGMGVGFSSTTASYNIGEIADNIISYLETGKLDNLIPDFATGGELILQDHIIDNINNNGRGTLKIRATANIDNNTISITEIPYSTTREAIIDRVVDLAKTDKLSEVTNIQDLTGFNKMEILVTARRNTDMNILLEKLYQLTPLESTYSVNSTVLFNDKPVLLGVKPIIKRWIKWRKECIRKELQYDINKLKSEQTKNLALEAIYDDIEYVIDKIRYNSKTQAVKDIRSHFNLTFNQAEYIYGLHLKQLNDSYIKDKLKEIKQTKSKIEELESQDATEVIISDMRYYKKYFNNPRRTTTINPDTILELRQEARQTIKEESIDDSDYWITITNNHYIYKTSKKSIKLKGDKIKCQYKMSNSDDEVFVYTHSRNGHKIQIRDLEVYSGKGLGDFLPGLLEIDKKDISHYGVVSENYPVVILLLTKGRIVRFDYSSYRPGVKVFSNTHTKNFDITHSLFLKKDKVLDIINKNGDKFKVDTGDIRTTKTRTGSGQYIDNNKRVDIKSVK